MPTLYPKDSVSSYSNQWDMINASNHILDAQIRKRQLEIQKERIDAILSEKEKHEKELLDKVKGISHHRLLHLLLIAGRFAFLGTLLPPYLLFFGIPKWIINSGAPILTDHLQKLFSPIIQKIELLDAFTKKHFGTMKKFLEKQGKVVSNVAEMINEIIKKIVEKTIGKPMKVVIKVVISVKNTVQKVVSYPNRLTQRLKKTFVKGANRLLFYPKYMIKNRLDKAKATINKMANQVKKVLTPAAKLLKLVAKATESIVKASKLFLQDSVNGVKNIVKNTADGTEQLAKGIRKQVNPLVERISTISDHLQKSHETFKNSAKNNYEKIRKKMELLSEDARRGIKRKFNDLVTFSMKVTTAITALLPYNYLNHMFKDNVLIRRYRKFLDRKKKREFFKNGKMAIFKTAIYNTCRTALRIPIYAMGYLRRLAVLLLNLIHFIFNAMYAMTEDILIGLKASYEFTFIFFSYGRLVVRNSSNEIVAWMRQQQVTRK